MKEEDFPKVRKALSEITGMPENQISKETELSVLAGKISSSVNGLLERLCMKLITKVSNNLNPRLVGDILLGNEKPKAWQT